MALMILAGGDVIGRSATPLPVTAAFILGQIVTEQDAGRATVPDSALSLPIHFPDENLIARDPVGAFWVPDHKVNVSAK